MQRKKKSGRGCLVVFFLIFFLAGTTVLVFFTLLPVVKSLSAENWPTAPCVIISSEVERSEGDDGPTYRVKVVYDYRVDDQQYRGDQYNFTTFYSGGYQGKKEIVDQYPPGSEHRCYYDPHDPSRSVLNPKLSAEMFIGLFGLIFIAVGLGGLLFALGFFDRKSAVPRPTIRDALSRDPHRMEKFYDLHREDDAVGEVTLKSSASPLGRFFFSLLFGLIWNGVVSVFLVMVVRSYLQGQPEVCLTIFLIPFVIVGIGVILFFVHSLLALFNPRPEITVSSRRVALGDPLDVKWRLRGSTGSVRQLTIDLEGNEHATYRRGTRTYTDTEEFAKVPIADATQPLQIASGSTTITIPADTMHSFTANHNQIVWTIHVHGEIGFWPDVDESFEVVLLPHNEVQAK
jgi:hypothetical protein